MYREDILDRVKRIHFVGIGGSGMCPLAEILHSRGFSLSGSDVYESDTLQRIYTYGIPVARGHKKENVDGAELVVYSAAIKDDNPELVAARAQNIPTLERCEMLGLLTKKYKNSVAISGTHGKTSTTAMLTQILLQGGKDPTSIIGGKLPLLNGNSCVGKSEIIVCEACEYVDSFLCLNPSVSVILNIDEDHLDYFKNLENIQRSFKKFAQQTTDALIINGDDENTVNAVTGLDIKTISFGCSPKNDYYAANVELNGVNSSFALMRGEEKLADISLKVPGMHNVLNALAAAVAAHYLGVGAEKIAQSLAEFTGVHRRFEILGSVNDIVVADDFAHHPTELTAVLTAAKSMNFKRVWAVFQPHTFSRTAMLLDEFAESLSTADNVVLSEILAVREVNTYNISSQDLARKIPGCVCLDTFEQITDFMQNSAKPGDLILTLGGGNVYKCANMILSALQEKYAR